MLKLTLIGGLGVAGAASGAYAYVASQIPSFNDVIVPCVQHEADQPPVQRMDTCVCLATETATAHWTARAILLPASRKAALDAAMLNTCRARSFQQNHGDRGPTRMSPMPRIGT